MSEFCTCVECMPDSQEPDQIDMMVEEELRSELRNCLRKLEAAEAKLRELTWTSADELPTEWGSYLVWHTKYGIETLFFQLKDGGSNGRKAGNWYSEDIDDTEISLNFRVTHWMPLPPAPKQEEK